MRWLVEVSSLGKTDLQKFCVEAESWQRALQAARAQRGEEGPMSGFSIELLEEGYRAVDPLARVRFVVKRAPDDLPVTAPTAKDSKPGVSPMAPSSAGATESKMSSSAPPASGGKSAPPRPIGSVPPPATSSTNSVAPVSAPPAAEPTSAKPSSASTKPAEKIDGVRTAKAEKASSPPPVGSQLPGLPAVKLIASREQNATEASPLTYREYAFAVPAGTPDETAADVLRAQLQIVESHIADAKMGRLVNLAVFDVEFKGKPPRAPLATLTWKDWKGEPILAFPQRGPTSQPPRPPSLGPEKGAPSAPPPAMVAAITNGNNVSTAPARASTAASHAPAPVASVAPISAVASVPAPAPVASVAPVSAVASVPAAAPVASAASAPAIVPPAPQTVPLVTATAAVAASAPAPATVSQPPPAPAQTLLPSQPPPAPASQTPRNSEPPPRRPSSPDGMVRTPSGRFVRGRVTGDELISSLFESMHDLHFLRDALDGGQFCLALATEVLPARAALIHFFDIERREWVVACTRGKDTPRLLNVRTPEGDSLLRDAARKRRAVVMVDAAPVTSSQRYQTIGGSRSLIVAPIMQAGRALGAIEIINPLDGKPFTEDEGNAMTYIAEQYAEYLGSRGIVLDRERIQSAAAAR